MSMMLAGNARPPRGDLSPGPSDPGFEAATYILPTAGSVSAVVLFLLWVFSPGITMLLAGIGVAVAGGVLALVLALREDRRARALHASAANGHR